MKDVILILIVVAIVVAAVWYIYKQKRRGNKCIGCPDADTCPKNRCGCGWQSEE